ncbi:Hypothetical predicted protein [Podarcis lilfordi]|uniref:Uncharacterized protein n=1 Tax=Podarcis lilfordi TaxID=74358 RepID=A0AA35PE35_9SAUR|nr:Hypothetical predicted protein [Podarcis lilfordi]
MQRARGGFSAFVRTGIREGAIGREVASAVATAGVLLLLRLGVSGIARGRGEGEQGQKGQQQSPLVRRIGDRLLPSLLEATLSSAGEAAPKGQLQQNRKPFRHLGARDELGSAMLRVCLLGSKPHRVQ